MRQCSWNLQDMRWVTKIDLRMLCCVGLGLVGRESAGFHGNQTVAVTSFVLRSLSAWSTEISRRFYSSLPPLFPARRCAALLYTPTGVAMRGIS